MKKITSLLFMLSAAIITGCSNPTSSNKIELSDIFASGELLYLSNSVDEPAWVTLIQVEEGKVQVTNLDENITQECEYRVEEIEENLYKYYFKGGQDLDLMSMFGSSHSWKEYNVIQVGDEFVFDYITDFKNNENATYEEIYQFYVEGATRVVTK